MKIKNVNLRKIIFNILKEEIEKEEIKNIEQSEKSIKSEKVFSNILDDDYINNWEKAGISQRPLFDNNKVVHDGWDIPEVGEYAIAYSPGFGVVLDKTKEIEKDIWQENFRFYKKDEGFGEGHGVSNTRINVIKSKISTAEADLKKIKDEISNQDSRWSANITKGITKGITKKSIENNIKTLKSDLKNLTNSKKGIPIKIEGGNIIYQAFPGLGYYDRSDNLQSGPKGLEDYWNADTKKYTGTPEQTTEIVKKMNVSQAVKNKWLECISVYSEKDRGSKYRAGASMEEGAAGGSISLLIKDPEDETEFIYTCLHMQSVFISPGQKVKPGQKIGTYGTSGRSTGIHLHLILKGYSSRLGEGGNTKKKVLDHNEWKNFFSRMDAELYDRKLADVGISDVIKKQKQEDEDLKNKMDASRKPSTRIKASDFLKRSSEEESKYIEQQKKDLENLKENFKYKNLDEFVDRLNEKKKRKKKPNGMRSVKKRADNNPKITRMDFLPDDVLNKIAKEKNLDEFVNKLDERKKRKKKYTAKNIPNNYKSKVSKKARSSMAREMNKCAKTPRPKSCYDYWDADKKHDKAMSESIERFVNIINENNEAGISINDDESNTIYYIKSENGKFLIKKENEKDFIKYNVTFTAGLIRNKPLEIKHISRVKDKNGKDKIEITVVYGIEYKKIITDEVKKEIIENYNKDLEEFTISGSLGSMTFQKMKTSNLAKEEIELDHYVELLYEKKLSKKTKDTLKKKAEKANMPLGALTSVYKKGLGAWLTGHRPGTPQHAWAMARVNSFIRGGKTRSVDKSEWKKVQKHRKK